MRDTHRTRRGIGPMFGVVLSLFVGGTDSVHAQVFRFPIDPKTPLIDLLPVPPKLLTDSGPLLVEDLREVPEVSFEEPSARELTRIDKEKQIALQIAKINFLNGKKRDYFVEALLRHRADLAGLPVVMGDACRMNKEHIAPFGRSVSMIRESMKVARRSEFEASVFWREFRQACSERRESDLTILSPERVVPAHLAALMQMLAPESADKRKRLAQYLAEFRQPEATQALARLAIFSSEMEVRYTAVEPLKKRGAEEYTDTLLQGLRYPWPPVARNAIEAVVLLQRIDLVPQLVQLLEEPDSRAPAMSQVDGESVLVVRELVRLNHHRNCLLCHPPGNTRDLPANTVTGSVPILGETSYYNNPDLIVRTDVTYLRQDFSLVQKVTDAAPGREWQRFDFLVRTRLLRNEGDVVAFMQAFGSYASASPSPYHVAALTALRQLTGQDAGASADDWRRLLKLGDRKIASR